MHYGVIYEILHAPSDKRYVGQTTSSVSQRWAGHVDYANRGGRTHLASAIRAYGADQFEIRVVEECPDRTTLDARETYWILELDTMKSGFNHRLGGMVRTWSWEDRAKFSENHPFRGRFGPEHPAYGYKHSDGARDRIRASRLGSHMTDETKKKLSEANSGDRSPLFGKALCESTKQKMSASLKNRPHHMRGKKHTPEMIAKFKQGHAGRVVSDETRGKVSQTMSGRTLTQEHKEHLRGKKEEVACPHCGKVGAGPTMQRWHFDKCKDAQ